jgi:sucrose-6-phosphatase
MKILICSDLDRTILPNGSQPESVQALPILHRLAERAEVTLVYVSGRNKSLLQAAISEYGIPMPDYAIGDVGTTLYTPGENWQPWQDWAIEISRDWNGKSSTELADLFTDLTALQLQEEEKQNSFKLSYYTDVDVEIAPLRQEMEKRLAAAGVRAALIWSIDEEKECGLLDILPQQATKLHAIRFLMQKHDFSHEQTVFAGDSGNDLPVLTSGLNAILVKNAPEDVKTEAVQTITKKGLQQNLYLAKGDFLGMNGNYCAGVLEGIAHFLPRTAAWMNSTA